MGSFQDTAGRAHQLVCPGCGSCALEVVLRCDLGDRGCLQVAHCLNCNGHFPDADTLQTFDELYERLKADAGARPCGACGSKTRTVRSTCDRIERECFFVTACEDCGKVETASGHS